MKLYHYATEKYPQLETLHYRQVKFDRKGASAEYGKHISFFFDPLNPMVLDEVYGQDHIFWKHGHTIWEHVTESHSIGDFAYEIVESPEKIKLLYQLHRGELTINQYYKKVDQVVKDHQYSGDQKLFDSVAHQFVGTTSRYQKEAKRYPNWDDIKNKYAACVPHVMLYPDKGYAPVSSASQITIGKPR